MKRQLSHLTALAATVVLAGCGSSEGEAPPSPPPVVEQDPGALRSEMNTLSNAEPWFHDVADVYIEGDAVVIRVAEHDAHEKATDGELVKMCENAFAAAKKSQVKFTSVTVILAEKVVSAVHPIKGETTCRLTP